MRGREPCADSQPDDRVNLLSRKRFSRHWENGDEIRQRIAAGLSVDHNLVELVATFFKTQWVRVNDNIGQWECSADV